MSCWLLRVNLGAWREHLTSLLSWVAAWLLDTRVFPVYLVKKRCYSGGIYLLLGGRWSWKRWESSELRRWERCVSGLRWQGGKGGRIVRWHSQRGTKVVRWQKGEGGGEMARWEIWENSEVARWEIPCFIQGWRKQGETKWRRRMCSRYFSVTAGNGKLLLGSNASCQRCGGVWECLKFTRLI